jgi:hypothetical protein
MRKSIKWAAEVVPEVVGLPSLVTPDLIRHWQRVLRRSRELLDGLPEPNGPTVLLVSTLGRKLVWPARAAVLAQALRLRGARPVVLTCDRWLPACEEGSSMIFTPEEYLRDGPRKMCDACFGTQNALFDVLGFPHHHFSEFHSADAERAVERFLEARGDEGLFDLEYRGLALGAHVESSVLRFFLRNNRPVGDEYRAAKGIIVRYARAAMLLAEVCERAFDVVRPDVLVVHFGCYVSRGVPPVVARRRGIRTAVLAPGYRRQAWTVGDGADIIAELAGREHGPWETLAMTGAREQRLQALLDRRVRGWIRNVPVEGFVSDPDEIRRRLQLDPAKPLVSLFTSIGWDAKSFYDTRLYPNLEDLVLDSIRIFGERLGLQLVVRIHPAEVLQPARVSLEEVVRREWPALPRNVRIVSPRDPVNSYTLGEMSKASVVYGSTIGLELAALGRAVIVAGRAPYARKGFTHDVQTRDDYLGYLGRLDELAQPDASRAAAARRFAYYRLFLREIPFRYWFRRGVERLPGVEPWWRRFRSLEDLQPGRDPDLDAMCQAILTGREALGSERR